MENGRYGNDFGDEALSTAINMTGNFFLLTGVGLGFGAVTGHTKEGLTYGLIVGGALAAIALGVGLWEYRDYRRQKREDCEYPSDNGRMIIRSNNLGGRLE